jgi:hypothetical protein
MTYITWGEVARLAGIAGAKYPELVAAQWALESNWGKSMSGKNNPFGLKGKGRSVKTTEFINGKEVELVDEFADFDDLSAAINYLVDRWYKDFRGYKGVNNAEDFKGAAKMLASEGYATDPKYADKLIEIIKKNSAPVEVSVQSGQLISLSEAAKWDTGLPHQKKAWQNLQVTLTKEQLLAFAKEFRQASVTQKPIEGKKQPANVPYFYQRDSKTGHGERSCQSSAIAMVIKYLNPKLITDDDNYLRLVLRYGDTVSQSAHQKALDNLGLKHSFRMNGSEKDLVRILDSGCPVPIGILHKGSITNPTGGGHWITLIGYDNEYFYVHDPFGKLDLANGGYPLAGPTDGKQQKYSRKNLMKRWLISNNSDGWYWDLSENKRQ